MRRIDTSLAALHEQYGEFEDEALFAHALKNEIPDLQTAYRDLKFEEVRQEALAAQEAKRAETTTARTEAKRDAAVVEGGRTTQQGGTDDSLPERPTVREALLHAIGK